MSSLPPAIRRRMQEEGGSVTLARFMDLALTDPEAGYYTGADRILGEGGDFTTAPRKAPAFNRAVARFLGDLIDSIPHGPVVVVEVGAGEGDLAAGILEHWTDTRPDLQARVSYRVDDVGEGLLRRQLGALETAIEGGWDAGVWGRDSTDTGGATRDAVGLIVSNELLDALPVHLVDVCGSVPREAWVTLRGDEGGEGAEPAEEWRDLSAAAEAELALVAPGRSGESLAAVSADGFMELRPAVRRLLEEWSSRFDELAVFTVDYGDWLAGPGDELPLPAPGEVSVAGAPTDLHRRSLRGYVRHQTTRDVYRNVGRQDLTADVDFRALALHGANLGYECVFYAPLASFLRAAGAGEELPGAGGMAEPYSLDTDIRAAPLASLLDLNGVGGLFKVMLQVREKDDG
ncbi:MAG: SAM-dependent methyltransferase [Thermoleophilia bacterium]